MSCFDPAHETMNRDDLAQLQLERLQALLARLKRNVRRYRELLGDLRLETLDDLARLPLTQPEDLVNAFPYGMFALPLREVTRLHSAVGPDGRPLVIGHTRNDLCQWGRLVARQLAAADVTAADVIQTGFEPAIARDATGYTLGAETLGASVMPEDPFHIEYQLAMLRNYRVTVLITTPANAQELLALLRRSRTDPQSLSLRAILLSRPVPPAEREELATGLFADVHCNFGVPEILDPGIGVECHEGRLHANEDHFLVETVNGELVLTTLRREAMPLLRYRTRLVCELRRERCPCGRTGVVLEPGRRLDGLLRIGETLVYPRQISAVLEKTRAAGQPFHIETLERRVRIQLQVTPAIFSDTIRALMTLKQEVEQEFMERLGIEAEVHFVEQLPPPPPEELAHPNRQLETRA